MSNKNYIIIIEAEEAFDIKESEFLSLKNLVETAKIEHAKSSNVELFEQVNLHDKAKITVIQGSISPAVKAYLNQANEFFATSVMSYQEEEDGTESENENADSKPESQS